MGPIWARQDQGGPHVGPMDFAIWVSIIKGWIMYQVIRTRFTIMSLVKAKHGLVMVSLKKCGIKSLIHSQVSSVQPLKIVYPTLCSAAEHLSILGLKLNQVCKLAFRAEEEIKNCSSVDLVCTIHTPFCTGLWVWCRRWSGGRRTTFTGVIAANRTTSTGRSAGTYQLSRAVRSAGFTVSTLTLSWYWWSLVAIISYRQAS